MRRGIITNDHDHIILKHLYYGGAPVSDILLRFFNTGPGTQATHRGRMWRRLNKMKEARLIKFAIDHTVDEIILFLDKKGAERVCNVYSLEIENAWLKVGRERNFYHDLTTADLARRLIYDATATTFSVTNLEYEHYLKREQGRKGRSTKGLGYPDFRVWIEQRGNDSRIYDVETDCGTVGRDAFEKKVKGSNYPLIIVTETWPRVTWLFDHAVAMHTNRAIYIMIHRTLPSNIFSPITCWNPPYPDPISLTIWNQ